MNINESTRAPSLQSMSHFISKARQNRTGGRMGLTSRELATALFQQNITEEILVKCKAIESEQCHGVHPKTRYALGRLLVTQKINNPGGLDERVEKLCIWAMLDHVAEWSNRSLPDSQLQSFVRTPDQMKFAKNITRQLKLCTSDNLIASPDYFRQITCLRL